jgi:hypothetical protein
MLTIYRPSDKTGVVRYLSREKTEASVAIANATCNESTINFGIVKISLTNNIIGSMTQLGIKKIFSFRQLYICLVDHRIKSK